MLTRGERAVLAALVGGGGRASATIEELRVETRLSLAGVCRVATSLAAMGCVTEHNCDSDSPFVRITRAGRMAWRTNIPPRVMTSTEVASMTPRRIASLLALHARSVEALRAIPCACGCGTPVPGTYDAVSGMPRLHRPGHSKRGSDAQKRARRERVARLGQCTAIKTDGNRCSHSRNENPREAVKDRGLCGFHESALPFEVLYPHGTSVPRGMTPDQIVADPLRALQEANAAP